MGRKSSKEYSVVFFFGGRRKVKVAKFAFEDFIFVVGSAANSVVTSLEFAAFRSGPEAKYSTASSLCFFLSTPMVFVVVRTHFPRKNTSMLMMIGILLQEKNKLVRLTLINSVTVRGVVKSCRPAMSAIRVRHYKKLR